MVDVVGFEPTDNNNRSITFGQYCPWKRAPADTRYRASSLHPQPYRQYYLSYHQFYLATFMSIILGGDTPFTSVRPKLFLKTTLYNKHKKTRLAKPSGFFPEASFFRGLKQLI